MMGEIRIEQNGVFQDEWVIILPRSLLGNLQREAKGGRHGEAWHELREAVKDVA